MKKKNLISSLAIVSLIASISVTKLFAYHNFFFRDAGDIISGTLDNNRVDTSSVTKRGQLFDGSQELAVKSVTASFVTTDGRYITNLSTGDLANSTNVAQDTTTLKLRLDDFDVTRSSTQRIVDQYLASVSTSQNINDSYLLGLTTSQQYHNGFLLHRDSADINIAGLRMFESSSSRINDQYLASVSTTQQAVKGWLLTQSTQVTGVVAGAYTNADVTVGADGRITDIANGAGGGGGGTFIREYDIYVGTDASLGVDVYGTNKDTLDSALSKLNAKGLTTSTTGYGTIHFGAGLYDMNGATVPQGITIYGSGIDGSSTVWYNKSQNGAINIYGKVYGVVFDNQYKAFDDKKIYMRSDSIMKKCRVVSSLTRNVNSNDVFIGSATRVKIEENTFSNWTNLGGNSYSNYVSGVVNFYNSTNCYFTNNKTDDSSVRAAAPSGLISVHQSTGIHIEGNEYYGGTFLGIGSCANLHMIGNKLNFTRDPYSSNFGYIQYNHYNYDLSTFIVKNNEFIIHYTAVNQTRIFSFVETFGFGYAKGVWFTGNSVTADAGVTAGSIYFCYIADATGQKILFTNNNCLGISHFIQDGGSGTDYTSNLNYLNNVEQ